MTDNKDALSALGRIQQLAQQEIDDNYSDGAWDAATDAMNDDVKLVHLALQSLPDAQGWRDISSAPRDGTKVYACNAGKTPEIASFSHGCWDIQGREDIEFRPRFWWPLPPSPPRPAKDKT